jgi:energy-coupling factor transporter ATP-binding protein EcfA2
VKLVIENVSKQYGRGPWALRDFTLQLGTGVLGLLGPNGAGKTTLMSILATITRASQGRARQGVLLAAWIWPLLIWSQMGCREARNATGPFLFSSERALTRQLPALRTAGVLVAAITGGGIGLRRGGPARLLLLGTPHPPRIHLTFCVVAP